MISVNSSIMTQFKYKYVTMEAMLELSNFTVIDKIMTKLATNEKFKKTTESWGYCRGVLGLLVPQEFWNFLPLLVI